jgi:hypothetical protein
MIVTAKIVIGSVILASLIGVVVIGPVLFNAILYPIDSDIIIDKNVYNNAHRDSVLINNVKIIQDRLIFNISYGGGCQDHEFSLIGTGEYAESYPIQTRILLSHNSNNDTCLALFTETLTFDLTPLKQDFLKLYSEGSETIILHIEGGNEGISVNYSFSTLF